MQISRKYRIASLLLAFLMAFSSFGYSVNLHFCQGSLKGFNLFGKAKSCHETMARCPNHKEAMTRAHEKDCCSNKVLKVENLDEQGLIVDFHESMEHSPQFNLNMFSTYDHVPSFKPCSDEKILLRPPPLPGQVIYILHESFLL